MISWGISKLSLEKASWEGDDLMVGSSCRNACPKPYAANGHLYYYNLRKLSKFNLGDPIEVSVKHLNKLCYFTNFAPPKQPAVLLQQHKFVPQM